MFVESPYKSEVQSNLRTSQERTTSDIGVTFDTVIHYTPPMACSPGSKLGTHPCFTGEFTPYYSYGVSYLRHT